MPQLALKPTHKVVENYYDSLAKFAKLGIKHETAVRSAFQELLEHCARQFDWKLVPEYRIKRKGQADISPDGALLDNYGLNHGLWEAKDSDDDLDKEIKNKFSIGYATDRIGNTGIICFVNNNSFATEKTFDGMRKELSSEFDLIYVLDLGGNVRKNPKLSGTTHNVFGIQVGVSINLFIRLAKEKCVMRHANVYYHAIGKDWRKERKYEFLDVKGQVDKVKWERLTPDKKGNWITNDTDAEFESFLPIGSKEAKASTSIAAIFRDYSLGVSTNRDEVAYDFDAKKLARRVEQFVDDYNAEVSRWLKKGSTSDVDNFVKYDRVKWSRDLKLKLTRKQTLTFDNSAIRKAYYRPFTQMALYCAHGIVDRVGPADDFFPVGRSERENRGIWLKVGSEIPMFALAVNLVPNLLTQGGSQCFPLFTYSEDAKHKQDNITPKARTLFEIFYDDDDITRSDIFHYVYAVLHHPIYRSRFAENLKRELPRIPFVGVAAGEKNASLFPLSAVEKMQGDAKPDHNPQASAKLFHTFADAGKKLADLHVNYESTKEFKLKRIENKEVKLDWRAEAMKLSKDKTSLFYNDFLTLSGIPLEVFDYKLGNRSALEWVIDQYRCQRAVKTSQ